MRIWDSMKYLQEKHDVVVCISRNKLYGYTLKFNMQ